MRRVVDGIRSVTVHDVHTIITYTHDHLEDVDMMISSSLPSPLISPVMDYSLEVQKGDIRMKIKISSSKYLFLEGLFRVMERDGTLRDYYVLRNTYQSSSFSKYHNVVLTFMFHNGDTIIKYSITSCDVLPISCFDMSISRYRGIPTT